MTFNRNCPLFYILFFIYYKVLYIKYIYVQLQESKEAHTNNKRAWNLLFGWSKILLTIMNLSTLGCTLYR